MLQCSFCEKAEGDVRKLIAGPGARVCDECVAMFARIVANLPGPVPEPVAFGLAPLRGDVEVLRAEIASAFSSVERPGNWALRRGNEGEEPYLVEKAFADKQDWRGLDPAFLDLAPDGFATALSFFSDEAFRYFLPAYLLADLDGKLLHAEPVFHLFHGLDDGSRGTPVNPRRYGARTWFDEQRHRFAVFTTAEAKAIVLYLRHKATQDDCYRAKITQAVTNYWAARAY